MHELSCYLRYHCRSHYNDCYVHYACVVRFICQKILKSRAPTVGGSANSATRCVPNVESEATLSGGVTSEDKNAASNNAEPVPDITTSDSQTDNEMGDRGENKENLTFEPLPQNNNTTKGRFLTAMVNRISKIRGSSQLTLRRPSQLTLMVVFGHQLIIRFEESSKKDQLYL